ncbi:hypothetical protein BDM02DRAFT_3157534 [Thelephora ganbajun]|uniref:Uncharacterized protein n=1 Tax=Thelephora ganbajun TaxID=370292 RepID=A0ACB6YZZ2_THEGA|nr:hypothetical protein BDM02DRAFT_3157534 [Thelephora ganbajun]
MWRPSEEAYTSDEMVNAYEEVQNIPPDPSSPNVENVVVKILVYLDATWLAQFGTASAHPIYSFFGNLLKYIHCQPGSHAAHHTAYFPQLPDLFTDWYRETFSRDPSDEIITHCKWELIHAVWMLILNTAFMMAYQFGILVCFADKIICHVFPHLFAYMADYPEKILMAGIRNMGICPCPWCLIPKAKKIQVNSHHLQAKVAIARDIIYRQGNHIYTNMVNDILKSESLVPTTNVFHTTFADFDFNTFSLFIVDLMHKFKLGVFRDFLIHLLQLLYACGVETIAEFDHW